MSELGAFQNEFVRVLLGDDSRCAQMTASLGPGLAVHRNTVVKGLIDVLAANYPTIERLVGGDWFAACATQYARAHPPTVPALALYGAGFANFLSSFPPAAELPYLPDVARIDRLWTEAHFARDAQPLAGYALALLTPAQIFQQRLALHPATRFGWFSNSAVTIWRQNRPPVPTPGEIEVDGASEGALLTRPRGAVECVPVGAAGYAFLTRLRDGASLGDAATAALAVVRTADIADQLAQFIAAGAFAHCESRLAGDYP